MSNYPFAAIVGADEMALALLLTTVSPEVGGVLVRGEKGTAKSTMVRALAEILPRQAVVHGCRFGCDPRSPAADCPDGPHSDAASTTRPARLVELPVGATEDRVIGSLDLSKALGHGETAFEPGLLAQAHRGLLYVDEVNLLHDHLVDLLLDAAAMGRNTVERDGVSVSHPARIGLVGTMNPEEGELRPQLLDRFGLTVEVKASRDPAQRADVVRRRLAFDEDPVAFQTSYAVAQADLADRIASAQEALGRVRLSDWALDKIATVCAGFEVDGMRADIVTARAAVAHAAWEGRTDVTREDIRTAAKLALPHRRRRAPFDAPGLDEDLLDRLLGDDEPPPPEDPQDPQDPEDPHEPDEPDRPERPKEPSDETDTADDDSGDPMTPPSAQDSDEVAQDARDQRSDSTPPDPTDTESGEEVSETDLPAPVQGVAAAHEPYRIRRLTVRGTGSGAAGKRSRAITTWGRTVGSSRERTGRVHLTATITAAARERGARATETTGTTGTSRLEIRASDLRSAITQGKESNLVLLLVDASGSMAARSRMAEVKTAVLSLLMDAYQRRDRVGLVTFRGTGADLALPPTSSVEAAAACLAELPHGGRTPLAEGLATAAKTLGLERIRDPRRRALLVLVTDGRATAGVDALGRAQRIADQWGHVAVDTVVIDCESGRFRMGLARDLADRMGAEHVPLEDIAADHLVALINDRRAA